jgi:branched-subunit amino acid transport protein
VHDVDQRARCFHHSTIQFAPKAVFRYESCSGDASLASAYVQEAELRVERARIVAKPQAILLAARHEQPQQVLAERLSGLAYAIRPSLIALLGWIEVPPIIRRALRFVPPAVLSAILFPELLRPRGTLNLPPGNVRLLAGILVAWHTRNALLTIAVGMAALWILTAIT